MVRVANAVAAIIFEGGEVEVFFALEVVVEQRLVDAGGRGDLLGAGTGEAVRAELLESGVENAGTGFCRAFGSLGGCCGLSGHEIN